MRSDLNCGTYKYIKKEIEIYIYKVSYSWWVGSVEGVLPPYVA